MVVCRAEEERRVCMKFWGWMGRDCLTCSLIGRSRARAPMQLQGQPAAQTAAERLRMPTEGPVDYGYRSKAVAYCASGTLVAAGSVGGRPS